MHIALILPDLEIGGAQRVMLFLAAEFSHRGHTVDLVRLKATGPMAHNIPNGVRLVDLNVNDYGPLQAGFLLSSVLRLSAWLRKAHPDTILSTLTGANLAALLARRLTTNPARIVIREAVTLRNIRSKTRLAAMRWLYPKADAVIALTPVMRQQIIERIGIHTSKICCIQNPVDHTFITQQGDVPVTHKWLGTPEVRPVISVGRLIKQKDYPTLLRAFSQLPKGLAARLLILGEGPEQHKLESLAEQLQIRQHIDFLPFDSNPWRWMKKAQLFVLSSRWEGHPNALLEARALDLPAVITRYDGYDSHTIDDSAIDTVDAGDAEALSKAIQQRLRQPVPATGYPFNDASNESVENYLAMLTGS